MVSSVFIDKSDNGFLMILPWNVCPSKGNVVSGGLGVSIT